MSDRALVIDDEFQLRRLLRVALQHVEVLEASTGAEGLKLAAQWNPRYILLDLGLPDMDGKNVLLELRKWYCRPIIILSVRNGEGQIVDALDAGADDYVTKPFRMGELQARIRAALRNNIANSFATEIFCEDPLRIELQNRRVFIKNTEVKLTVTEYDMLLVLIRNAGKVVTQRQLLREVWGPNLGEQSNYLRVYINHLRQKIEEDPQKPKLIITESGVGYRMVLSQQK